MNLVATIPLEDKPDIVVIVEQYTALKRAGRQLQGLPIESLKP